MAARFKKKSRSLISSCRRGGVVQEFLDHTTPALATLFLLGLLLNRKFLLARLRRAFSTIHQPPVARYASLTGG